MKLFRWAFIALFIALGGLIYRRRNSLFLTPSLKSANPTDQWLFQNAPPPIAPGELQILYATLIRGYWVPQTGLFLSFPGSGDRRLTQQAALYDQGIAGILLLAVGDTVRAQKITDFFAQTWEAANERAGPRKGVYGLSNFYNAYYGVEGIEKTMHVGPNAWIGLLASRVHRRTGNPRALQLALKIAHWMSTKVPHARGAIAMGQIPWNGIPWPTIYSTENNLSAYAFFSDLLKSSDLSAEDRSKFENERQGIERWLLTQAYQPAATRVIRGFNAKELDTAGAIDSYTWYTDALEPATLRSAGIPVEALVRKAETDYTVAVDGRRGVDCVDTETALRTFTEGAKNPALDASYFRPAEGGHRLVWYEGTGQFIVLLLDAGRDAVAQAMNAPSGPERAARLEQARAWLDEARRYTQAMDDASMTLPWGRAYPCATGGQFYVYGWPAPAPSNNHLSDASAALVWRMFAGLGYEPLTDRWLSRPAAHQVRPAVQGDAGNSHTPILYGASEEMTVRAWKLLDQKNFPTARAQAQATIALWETHAQELERQKAATVHGYLPYDGTVKSFQAIVDYWALNDVAACYFILGRIDDLEHHPADAVTSFKRVLEEYPLAQVWDTHGWFWNPVDAIQTDYAQGQNARYRPLLQLAPHFHMAPAGR